jgi:hypothetical protein
MNKIDFPIDIISERTLLSRTRQGSIPPALPLALLVFALLSPLAHACTGFIVRNAETTLVGNNEDNNATNLRIWFIPGGPARHGMVYFGTFDPAGNAEEREGGMNDQGLFMDGFAVPRLVPAQADGTHVKDLSFDFVDKSLAECATVGEVEALARRHRIRLHSAQWMFGDRNGDSIIIEGERIIRSEGHFQVCTNFRQSELADRGPTCPRFQTATGMLSRMETPTVASCREILRAVSGRNTQYSYVLDLNARRIHYYHFHDFDREIVFDLEVELAKGHHSIDTVPLFPSKLGARMLASRGAFYFASFTLWFLLFSLLFWGLRALVRGLKKAKADKSIAERTPGSAKLALGAIALLQSAYLLLLLSTPRLVAAHGGALRPVPWLFILLNAWLLVVCWKAWRARYWTLAGRIHCTAMALSSLGILAVLASWRLF